MVGRAPIVVAFALIIFSISVVVYWLLTGSLLGFFASKKPEKPPEMVATNMPVNNNAGATLSAPVAPSSAVPVTTQPPAIPLTPKPAAPPPPPPPDVYWSRLNEQIYTLEDARKALVNAVIERLPEEQKQQPQAAVLPKEIAPTNDNSLLSSTATNDSASPEMERQTVTWQQMTQQMLLLEQERQRLVNAVAKQVSARNPDSVPIQPLTFDNDSKPTVADAQLTAANETPQALSALDLSADTSELLDTYLLRPTDTNNLLDSRQSSLGYVFILSDLVFQTDQDRLEVGTLYMLDRLAKALNALPQQDILIEGHSDDRGSSDYNLQLSQRRAAAVQQALLTRGVAQSRMQARGYGELLPIASNHSEAGRLKNRRVEITLLTNPLTE